MKKKKDKNQLLNIKVIKEVKVPERNEKGQLLPGTILNPQGRPRNSLSYGGRYNREKREFFLNQFYETIEHNLPMLYGNLMNLCAQGDKGAILGSFEYFLPKLKEKEEESHMQEIDMSADQLKELFIRKLEEMEKEHKEKLEEYENYKEEFEEFLRKKKK